MGTLDDIFDEHFPEWKKRREKMNEPMELQPIQDFIAGYRQKLSVFSVMLAAHGQVKGDVDRAQLLEAAQELKRLQRTFRWDYLHDASETDRTAMIEQTDETVRILRDADVDFLLKEAFVETSKARATIFSNPAIDDGIFGEE